MSKFKLSPSQKICLTLVVIGLTLVVCSGRSHLGILIPISIGVFMPFYSLSYTGSFTYFPKAKTIEKANPTIKREVQTSKIDKPKKTSENKTKEYDLRDIPYPPKRNGDRPISSLPYGNGLSPAKQVAKASTPRCALLGPKPAIQADNRKPETPVGATLPLFNNAVTSAPIEVEEVFIEQDSIFL